eukprot:2048296-Rhodomonas_salina.1
MSRGQRRRKVREEARTDGERKESAEDLEESKRGCTENVEGDAETRSGRAQEGANAGCEREASARRDENTSETRREEAT